MSTYEPLIQFLAYFFIYSFTGWCVEIAYHALTKGHFVNRGMLNGPVCPIYGAGVGLLLVFMRPFIGNWFLSIVAAAIICSILELIVGLVLRKLFHAQWWDYSTEPFNIAGLVCLRFSIAWGFGGAFLLKIIHPLIRDLVALVPTTLLLVLVVLSSITILTDCIITVSAILKIQKQHALLNELEMQMHQVSVSIGEGVTEFTLDAQDRLLPIEHRLIDWHNENIEELNEKREAFEKRLQAHEDRREEFAEELTSALIARKKERLDQLEQQYQELQHSRSKIEERFEKAFTTMKWFDH